MHTAKYMWSWSDNDGVRVCEISGQIEVELYMNIIVRQPKKGHHNGSLCVVFFSEQAEDDAKLRPVLRRRRRSFCGKRVAILRTR